MRKNFLIGVLGALCFLHSTTATAGENSSRNETLLKLINCVEQGTCGEVFHKKGDYRFEAWFEVDGVRYVVHSTYDPIRVNSTTGKWIRPSGREVSVSKYGGGDSCSGLEIIAFDVDLVSKEVEISQAWRVEDCRKTQELQLWQEESVRFWTSKSRTTVSDLQVVLPRRPR